MIAGGGLVGTERGDGSVSFKWYHLLLPIVAAVLYGSSHIIRKVGIDLAHSPLIASAVTITTSWLLATGYLLATRTEVSIDQRQLLYFSLAGLASSVAIPTLYLALQIGLVVVVSPMLNLSPIFILILSFLFFRNEEIFSRQIILGTVTVVIGIMLLTVYGTVS